MGPMLTTCPSYPAQLTKINIALTRFAIWTWGALDYNPSKLTNTLSKKLLLISPGTVKSSINWHSYCFEITTIAHTMASLNSSTSILTSQTNRAVYAGRDGSN
jgi:hypothetical protein